MKSSFFFSVFFCSSCIVNFTQAQTPLGQPSIDEQKVQVWCAAVRYVYDDNGRGNLKDKLNCGSSLKTFENSIKADSQKVYSLLYQPLEGRGTMYNGLGSNPARLQKLTTEIVNRLKSSPARRADPARMQRLATLEAALNSYVNNGTPIGNLAAAEPVADTTTDLDEATASAPADAGPDEAGLATSGQTVGSSVGEGMMDKFFGPLALILALLSLVLYWLLRRDIGGFQKEMGARIDKRRDEILALQNSPAPGGSGKVADRFSPAQQREVEKLVEQRVAEEIQKIRREMAGATPVPATPAARPVAATAPVAAPQKPAPVAEAPRPLSEVPAPPAAIPAGSPTASPRDEFESLVPPVQLPQPEPAAAAAAEPVPMAAPVEPAGPAQYTRYVKVPVNGAFSEYDLSDEPQHDSIYEIHFDPQWPELATFNVTPNPAIHAYAIQSAQYSLREACRYQQPSGPVTRIVTEEEGVLRKVAGNWQIEQKAAIRFE